MSKGNTFENDILKLVLNATPIADIADNDATSPLTSLYIALHISDPGEAGSQTTGEVTTAAYPGYARVAIARNNGAPAWDIPANIASNLAAVVFPLCTAGGTNPVISHVSIGTLASGAGKLLVSGALGATLIVSNGVTPRFEIAQLQLTED